MNREYVTQTLFALVREAEVGCYLVVALGEAHAAVDQAFTKMAHEEVTA
jgi:hypothetical protein